MKKYIGSIILVVSIIVAGVLIKSRSVAVTEEKKVETPYVKTMMILPRTVEASISSQGIVQPESDLTLLSELNSRVEWLSPKMEAGSSFKEGDTLLVLDSRDYELVLITAESQVLNAEVNLEREQAESELAKKEWKRVGAGSASNLALRKPQMAQAKATYAAAKARLEQARRNLGRTIFIAPFDGRVRISNIELRTTVFPGTLIGNIYATGAYEIRLPVADQDVPFIGLEFNGQKIEESRRLDVIIIQGDNKWAAKIVRTEAEIDPVTKMMAVVAKVNNSDKKTFNNPLAVGQFVQAKISGIEIPDISVLPRSSVRNGSVWIVDNQMSMQNRLVEVIRNEDEFALIREGFESGDRLLTSRVSSLVNGLKVTLELK
jgi:RND family efflux transporter MFP subunit|tara:strand:- start:5054 stop:6178 length:1125 start_codon:yes stop_codon:yes gene_type:complete